MKRRKKEWAGKKLKVETAATCCRSEFFAPHRCSRQPALCWLSTHFSHSHFVATSTTEIKHTADSAHMWDGGARANKWKVHNRLNQLSFGRPTNGAISKNFNNCKLHNLLSFISFSCSSLSIIALSIPLGAGSSIGTGSETGKER